MAIDISKLPPVLPVLVKRTNEDGTPTKELIDWEQYTRDWYGKSAIDLDTRLTEVKATAENAEALITEETDARVAADAAFAGQLTTVQTTLNANTAGISTLQASYDGIAVLYGVQGYINGVTGGFVFTGVLRNDGTVSYNMEISANVTIYGNLVVDGTINNAEIGNNAVSNQAVATAFGAGGVSVGMTTRASRILISVTVSNTGASNAVSATNAGYQLRQFPIYVDGVQVGELQSVDSYTAHIFGGGSSYTFYRAITPASTNVLATVGAGAHTFTLGDPYGFAMQFSIVVTELSK